MKNLYPLLASCGLFLFASFHPASFHAQNCDALTVGFEAIPNFGTTVVNFNDQTTMANGQILSWQWDFGDTGISTEQNPMHTYPVPGTYAVCLKVQAVTSNGFLCEKTFCQNIAVSCGTKCTYSIVYELNGTALHARLDPEVPNPPPFFFYANWLLDDGSATGTGSDFTHLISTPGRHTLCVTYPTGDFTPDSCIVCIAFDVPTPCVDSSQIDLTRECPLIIVPVCGCNGVTYENACEAYYQGGVTSWVPGICGSICNELFVDFKGANTGGSLTAWTFLDKTLFQGGVISSWVWDFGTGQISMEQNPSFDFLTPGEYNVCLTVSGLFADGTQCGGSVCKKIIVGKPCVDPSVINPDAICPAIYAPVCGCDGNTYSNECEAYYHHGVTAWTNGVCTTGCVNPALIDSSLGCIKIYDPVCGCDGKTYANSCVAVNYAGVTSWTRGACCQSSSGVDEHPDGAVLLAIYPNPAHGLAQVIVSGATPQQAVLFDLIGRRIWEKTISISAFEVETQKLPAGTYLLQVKTSKGVIASKMVVDK